MNFIQLTQHIKQTHEVLQSYAAKSINLGLTLRNYLIGHFIVEYEQQGEDKATYGEHLLEKISASLAQSGLKNISSAELSRFRQFYTIYPQFLGTLSQKSLHLPEQILGTMSQKLVFYHRILHCHILVEIKVDKFRHEYIGQLNAYLEHYKRHEMHEGDNPPVGILLVTSKNNTLVEYATGTLDNQLFVSRYLLELPQKEELERIIEQEMRKNYDI
jgi:hypothetical protein